MLTEPMMNNKAWRVDGVFHPCYFEEAHKKFARVHLPVAPRCNIQCRFCSRLYDCANETRPGVTSKVLSPEEALERVNRLRTVIPNLSVIGIAGPGEPLANKETIETYKKLKERHSDLAFCIATNGLHLSEHVDELAFLGIEYVTVTVNALDDEIGGSIYAWARDDNTTFRDKEAFRLISKKQWDGISRCVSENMVVKVNSVFIPGLNEPELPRIAERAKSAGVFVMNVIPFIPVQGSEFQDRKAPNTLEVKKMREECAKHIRQINHCARCRADAAGLLGHDISSFIH